MKTRRAVVLPCLALAFLLCIFGGSSLAWASGFSVSLRVENTLDQARENEPARAGVPLPRSAGVADASQIRMRDAGGNAVPCQITVTARWGAPISEASAPIKWLLADFSASVPAGGSAAYTLGTGLPSASPPSRITVEEGAEEITIDTGRAQFSVSKKALSLIRRAVVDGTVVTDSEENGIVLKSSTGELFSSSAAEVTQISWLESGPLRSSLQIKARLQGSSNLSTDISAVLTFFAGEPAVRVLVTLGRHGTAEFDGCCAYDVYDYYGRNSLSFSGLWLALHIYSPSGRMGCIFPGGEVTRAVEKSLTVYQDSSGTEFWARYDASDHPRPNSYSSFRGFFVADGAEELSSGDQYEGWMDASDGEKGVATAVTDFWQNYPKGFYADPRGLIRVDLFPELYAGGYNFRIGEEKTTEVMLNFHPGQWSREEAEKTGREMVAPLTAWAPPEWYVSSGALGPAVTQGSAPEEYPARAAIFPAPNLYEYYNLRTISADTSYTGLYYYSFHSLWESSPAAPSAIRYFNVYGWAAYGNQPLDFEMYGDGKAGYFDTKYDLNWGAWMQFLRTGDSRWKEAAEAFSRYVEQLMLHDIRTMYDTDRWNNGVFGHCYHNETGNRNGQRNYCGPVMETGFGARGAALDCYLTGAPVSRRFVEKLSAHALAFFSGRFEQEFMSDGAERTYGNLLSILTEAWLLTGDKACRDLAVSVMNAYAPEKQPYINGPQEGLPQRLSPWMLGLYMTAMARFAEAADELGYADDAALARARAVAYVNFFLDHVAFKQNGWLTVPYYWYANGQNPQSEGLINNWMLLMADSCAWAFRFSRENRHRDAARDFFETGARNPFFESSPLIYSTVKEAVNHAAFGQVALAEVPADAWSQGAPEEPGGGEEGEEGGENPPDAPCGINLVENGDASGGLSSWSVKGNTADTPYVDGDPAFYLLWGRITQNIDLYPAWDLSVGGATLAVSAWVRAGDAALANGHPVVCIQLIGAENAPSQVTQTLCSEPAGREEWQEVRLTVTLPSFTRQVRISLQTEANLSGGRRSGAYFDDVSACISGVEADPGGHDDSGEEGASPAEGPVPLELSCAQNLLANGDASLGTSGWDAKGTSASVVEVDGDPALYISWGSLLQAVDVQSLDGISGGALKLMVSCRMKAKDPSLANGHPQLWVQVVGAENAPKKVTENLLSEPAGNGEWETRSIMAELSPFSREVRVRLKTEAIPGGGPRSGALFDDITACVSDGTSRFRISLFPLADAYMMRTYPEGNFGAADELVTYNGLYPDYRSVLAFSLGSKLPQGARIERALLALFCRESDKATPVRVYRLTEPFTEGTGTYGNTRDGVTWTLRDGSAAWSSAGGTADTTSDYGFGANGIAAEAAPFSGEVFWDLTGLVSERAAEGDQSLGLLLTQPDDAYYTINRFGSKESGEPPEWPRLVIEYASGP
ncbi:MAG: DNRLRE domain-containing protein [Thermodesulfobacteriota bacterium]